MTKAKKDTTFKTESTKLSKIIGVIKDARSMLEQSMEKLGAFNLEKLKELRDSPATNSADFLLFMEMLKNKNVAFNIPEKYKKLEELTYLQDEPYFSRIDLKTKEGDKKYYIGKFGFTQDKSPLVIDWRADIASIYYKYRYPQKNITYETHEGIKNADLLLKRTFDISGGELIKYYNNDIQLDESDIIAEKIERRTGGVLEDIVATIQSNQHEIIKADPRKVCVVQGSVGSGKSTVAIHKLSHIFFNFRNVIRPEKTILIAKNQILVGYLSTLFPKLGIFNINYGTLRDVIYRIIFQEDVSFEFDLSLNTDLSNVTNKDVKRIKSDVSKIHKKYKDRLIDLFEEESFKLFAGFVYDNKQPVRQNLTEAIKDIQEELKYQSGFIKEHPNHPRSKLFSENVKIMKRLVKKLSSIRSDISSKELKSLCNKYKIGKEGKAGYKEALMYIYIYSELFGFSKFEKYEYCVIDEGQDFNTLEYMCLNKLVRNGRFCILGDLNQCYSEEGLTNWDQINDQISGAKQAQTFMLDTNYRSTRPIVNFAKNILAPHTKNYLPKSINRSGKKPTTRLFDTNNDIEHYLKNKLSQDIKNLKKSVGIICLDRKLFENIDQITKSVAGDSKKYIKLDSSERIRYLPKAVYLADFNDCKGLEFGKVYVVGLNLEKIDKFNDAKKAFVAVTRAMDELEVLGVN